MNNLTEAIAPAFRKMPRMKIANKRWILRSLSLLVSASRLLYRCPESIVTTLHRVQGRDNNTIKVIEIAPKSLSTAAPAIVYYHGGGFFMSYGRLHLKQAEAYAEQLQVRVFFVQYRLSTEQIFPGPLNDCMAALDWVYANADQLKVKPERIAVMGDSAGGCLAASVAQQVFDENKQRDQPQVIRAQLLIYPALDSDCKTHSAQSFTDTPIWNASNNKIMWQVYLGQTGRHLPLAAPTYASPIHRDDFSGLPPAYIESAEFDPLRDEAQDYADALTVAGVEVRHALIAGAVHGYDYVECEITQKAKAHRLASMQALLCD